jgi:RNA polymerase subunit RPABC4/transcription elongation factor Spt4
MKKLICENCKSIHEEGSKQCYCGSTTLSPTHKSNKTDREKAMEWWIMLTVINKMSLGDVYYRRNSLTDEKEILNLLREVVKDCDELSDDIPIRNKKGEIYGSMSLYPYLEEKFKNKIRNN